MSTYCKCLVFTYILNSHELAKLVKDDCNKYKKLVEHTEEDQHRSSLVVHTDCVCVD